MFHHNQDCTTNEQWQHTCSLSHCKFTLPCNHRCIYESIHTITKKSPQPQPPQKLGLRRVGKRLNENVNIKAEIQPEMRLLMDKRQWMDREKRNEAVSSCSAWQILEYFFPSAPYPGVLRQQNVAADVKKLYVQPFPLQWTISQLIKILWQSQSLLKSGKVNIWIALLKN